jgi:hypothetical protein
MLCSWMPRFWSLTHPSGESACIAMKGLPRACVYTGPLEAGGGAYHNMRAVPADTMGHAEAHRVGNTHSVHGTSLACHAARRSCSGTALRQMEVACANLSAADSCAVIDRASSLSVFTLGALGFSAVGARGSNGRWRDFFVVCTHTLLCMRCVHTACLPCTKHVP